MISKRKEAVLHINFAGRRRENNCPVSYCKTMSSGKNEEEGVRYVYGTKHNPRWPESGCVSSVFGAKTLRVADRTGWIPFFHTFKAYTRQKVSRLPFAISLSVVISASSITKI